MTQLEIRVELLERLIIHILDELPRRKGVLHNLETEILKSVLNPEADIGAQTMLREALLHLKLRAGS